MLAGLANGVLGTMTAAKFDFGEMISPALEGTGLGLGISYDRDQRWGGMLGIGGNNTNLSVSFSQSGATTISGSYGLDENINLTSSYNTGSGVTNVGATYNFDKGSDYENLKLNAGYNFHTRPAGDSNPLFPNERERTGFSGSVTYTTPLPGLEKEPWNPSMTLGFNPNGLNSSLSTDGVNLGSVSNNGFQSGSQNWVQENISAAQSNAGSGGDQWLEEKLDDLVEGIKGIPELLASLPQEVVNSITSTLAESFGGIDFRLDRLLEGNLHIGEGGFLDFGNSNPEALGGILKHILRLAPHFPAILRAIAPSGGTIYCSISDCGDVQDNEDPDKEKEEPEKPKPIRETNLTEREAQEMVEQGLNPLDPKDVDKYLDGVNTDNTTKLKFLHPETSLSPSKMEKIQRMSTSEILNSLKPGRPGESLIVKPDGTIMNGNHRLYELRRRGLDIDRLNLPREIYE